MAKKQQLREPLAAQQISPPAAVSMPAPKASNAQKAAPVLAMGRAVKLAEFCSRVIILDGRVVTYFGVPQAGHKCVRALLWLVGHQETRSE